MKQTCVSMECPFIWYCKQYNLQEDHIDGCATQDKIVEAAIRLVKKQRAETKAAQQRGEQNA